MKNKAGWKKVGVVGVDSGQVMICDPCYIDSEWRKAPEKENVVPVEIYRDKVTGKTYACALHKGIKKVDVLFKDWNEPLSDYNKQTPNMVRTTSWEKLDIRDKRYGEFSYPGVCHTTLSVPGFGQLKYKRGHDGVGVVSSTHSGDGCYPVLAECDRNGNVLRMLIDFTVDDYRNVMTAEQVITAAKEA